MKLLTFLSLTLFLSLLALSDNTEKLETISTEKSAQLIESNSDNRDFIILDIRRPSEYSESHLKNSINIDYYADNFKDQISKLDKRITYLIYCRSGNRSGKTLSVMEDLQFENVYNMAGGIKKWIAENRPVVTK